MELKELVARIKENLSTFGMELDGLAEVQNRNQIALARKLKENLNKFDEKYYQIIYKGENVALTGIYKTKFF